RVHHAGDWIGYHAMLERFPRQRAGIAILCNTDSSDPSGLADRVADIILADTFPKSSTDAANDKRAATRGAHSKPGSPVPADRIVGSYFDHQANMVWRVLNDGGHLSLVLGSTSLPLTATGDGTFAVTGFPGTVTFRLVGTAPAQSAALRVGAD